MKWKAEIAMYILFCLAAIPLAWAAFDLLGYYASYPDSLQDRETHRDALLVIAVIPITMAALIPATVLALYFLIVGESSTRGAIVGLVGAYVASFSIRPDFPVDTIGNLAWDASSTSFLVVTPVVLLALRCWQKSKSPNPPLNRTRAA
jgi:tellurite resistance protein TehA-like permease